MLGLSPWISLLAVLFAAIVARVLPPMGRRVEEMLEGRAAPIVLGVAASALSLWVWGSLSQAPVMHDESAYLLQAELFARFHWTGAAPPVPAFFQQLYLLVQPSLASKYPPGNSLVLALGAIIGAPGLPVVIMNGCASALLFVLVRRVDGGVVALLTWVVWQSAFPIMYYHASYLSEGVTSLAWLATWWGIIRWRDGAGRRWLIVAAVASSWCMITRPLTGLALAVVTLTVVAWRCRREREWRDLMPALGAAMLVLCVLPLWNWRTTGDWRLSPLTAYTREYVPFDKPGFGAEPDERPSARLPRDQWITSAAFYQEHERHTIRALPETAWQRLMMIDRDAWYEWRGGLRIFALIGVLALTLEGWIAVAAFAVQFLFYLSYAHPAWYTMYYLECTPLPAFVTALGIVRCLEQVRAARRQAEEPPSAVGPLLLVAAIGLAGTMVASQVRAQIRNDHAYYDDFVRVLRQVPDTPAVVFVHYGEKHPDGIAFVRNPVDLQHASVWTVYDRGAQNQQLLAAASDRAAYVFDEGSWTLRRLDVARSRAGSEPLSVVPAGSVRELRGARRPH